MSSSRLEISSKARLRVVERVDVRFGPEVLMCKMEEGEDGVGVMRVSWYRIGGCAMFVAEAALLERRCEVVFCPNVKASADGLKSGRRKREFA